MRVPFVVAVIAALSACAPTVPESGAGAGVGFNDYNSYLREREASAARGAVGTGVPLGGDAMASAPSGFSTDAAAAAIDRATGVAAPDAYAGQALAPLDLNDPNRPRGNAPTTIQEQSGEMAAINGGSAGISDEQDFNAVKSRETIESDKARIERNRAQYTVIQPTAVPQRTGKAGPNIVEFALATTHSPGTQMYPRSSLRFTDPNVACGRYGSPDMAQEAFLAAGGPQKDRKGLDPDGDGFACAWDPRPFRTALQ
jgi:hypothetical protein